MLQKSQIYRLDGGGRKNQDDSVVDHRNRRPHNRNSPSTETEEHNLQFAIARVALLLCSSRSPKSCSFHVEKVIVFSLLLAICFYHVIIINLGGLHSGTIARQVQPPPPTVLYYACLLCLLLALLATVSS